MYNLCAAVEGELSKRGYRRRNPWTRCLDGLPPTQRNPTRVFEEARMQGVGHDRQKLLMDYPLVYKEQCKHSVQLLRQFFKG